LAPQPTFLAPHLAFLIAQGFFAAHSFFLALQGLQAATCIEVLLLRAATAAGRANAVAAVAMVIAVRDFLNMRTSLKELFHRF